LIPFPFANITAAKSELSILYSDQLKSDISGAIFLQDGRFTVLINANKPPVRQYFTVAHELGHYYLHRQWLEDNNASGFVDYSPTLDSDNMLLRPDEPTMASGVDLLKEREANNFAAALLMPEKEVRQVWKLTHSISECAKTFQVSTSAMAIRLERLGLQ
jgi:Zn-dependent peptidase ImmA (M78 family)